MSASLDWTGREGEPQAVLDEIEIDVAPGWRALIASDLHLEASAESTELPESHLVQVLEGWSGPGVLVLAGDILEMWTGEGADPRTTLAAHGRFVAAVRSFSEAPDRTVVYLVGNHDGPLAWDANARCQVIEALGCQLALAADLKVLAGRGVHRVRVEHGNRLDPANAFTDPRNPLDSPLGYHMVRELLPAARASERRWLRGVDRLVDPMAFPSFIASRLSYRRIWRLVPWLLVPFILALLLRSPLAIEAISKSGLHAHWGPWSRVLLLVSAAVVADVLLVLSVLALAARQTWQAVATTTLERRGRGQNDAHRREGVSLMEQGYAGLITGHTHHPELTPLGDAFYANSGTCADMIEERKARFGLPPVFLPLRLTSWIEMEAGADLYVRLFFGRRELPGATALERSLARSSPEGSTDPGLVASLPGGSAWPPVHDPLPALERARRRAGWAIAASGLLNIVSASTPPLAVRLHWLRSILPLAVPEAAAALTALAGLAILILARGIRRGWRRAWIVAVSVLLGSASLHLLKGVDLEESLATLGVTAYLIAHRAAFRAAADRRSLGWAVLAATFGAGLAIVAGTAAVELVGPPAPRLPLGRALLAVAGRLFGASSIPLPAEDFLSTVLLAVGFGLVALVGWAVFRPLIVRGRAGGTAMARAREVVQRYGGDTLAYFALRDDKRHFFFRDTVVAYREIGGICLVSPDPVGPKWEREEAWAAFRRFADSRGRQVAVLGAAQEWLAVYRRSGLHDLYVGDEAIVDCRRFTLEGGRMKSLRQAVNRVARHGYHVEFFNPAIIPAGLRTSLSALIRAGRRGKFERGFSMTLGRALDTADPGLLIAVAFDPTGVPAALCQYVPAADIGGFSLDLMRRSRASHPNGLIDFVLVETIRHLREQGAGGLGLNFAVGRALLAGERDRVGMRAGRWLLRTMSRSMQIESLWRFNEKYDPDWQPRYLIYSTAEWLLPTALAVARAESFWELPVIGRLLAGEKRADPPGECEAAPSRSAMDAAAGIER